MFNKTLRTALLGSGAAVALMAGPALAGQTEDLKAQIDQLQSRLDQLEKQQSATETKQVSAAPADAVVGGDFPGSFKLPGSDTSVAIHGYTKLDVLYDFEGSPGFSMSYPSIPRNHSVGARQDGQFRLHARQSRLNIETRTPTDYGMMKTFIEGDFFGSAGNEKSTNSHGFRLRQAYGQLGPVLAGQTWSNFLDLADQAETLDFAGPAGTTTGRKPQVRYTQAFGKLALSGSIENPTTDVQTTAGATNGTNIQRMPDLTARADYTDTWGHASLSGVLRQLSVDNGLGGSSGNQVGTQLKDDTLVGGGQVGASLNIGKWIGGYFAKDVIAFEGYAGDGLATYLFTSTGQNNSAVAVVNGTGTDVSVKGQTMYGGFAWVQHFWTNQLRSTLVYGRAKVDYNSAVTSAGTQVKDAESIHANLIWSPVKSVNIGLEFIYGGVEMFVPSGSAGSADGNKGNDERLQAAFQYVF